jgi:hypothetical protein
MEYRPSVLFSYSWGIANAIFYLVQDGEDEIQRHCFFGSSVHAHAMATTCDESREPQGVVGVGGEALIPSLFIARGHHLVVYLRGRPEEISVNGLELPDRVELGVGLGVLRWHPGLENHLDGCFVATVVVRGQKAFQSSQLGVVKDLFQHVSLTLNGVLGPCPHRVKVHSTDGRLTKVAQLGGRIRILSLQFPEYVQVTFEGEERVITVSSDKEVVFCSVLPLPSSLEPCLMKWIVLVSVLTSRSP